MLAVYCVSFTVKRTLRKQAVRKTNGDLGADAFLGEPVCCVFCCWRQTRRFGMKQENRRGKALSVVMSATLAATFGVPALAVADEAAPTPAAIE